MCRRMLKPSTVALRLNSFVLFLGLRGTVRSNGAPFCGGFGNIKASLGSLTKPKLTAIPSGTPATRRR